MRSNAEAVKVEFDRQAATWSARYDGGGGMAARVGGFVMALENLGIRRGQVLDFGCGTGNIAAALANEGHSMFLVDMSPKMLAVATSRHELAHARTIAFAGGVRLELADQSLDAVIASSVLEYVEDPSPVIAEFRRVLVPGGVFVATVPSDSSLRRRVEAIAQRFLPFVPARRLWPSRVRGYAEYLRLSTSRMSAGAWADIARGEVTHHGEFLWVVGRR